MNLTRKQVLSVAAASLALAALPAGASAKTLHLYSHQTFNSVVDSSGNPVHGVPSAGDTFTARDDDYLGNHAKHAKKIYASDHLSCTFLAGDDLPARCDGQVALPGGMILFDRQTIEFGAKTVIRITGGTGKYDGVKKGTLTNIQYSDTTDDSDFIIKF